MSNAEVTEEATARLVMATRREEVRETERAIERLHEMATVRSPGPVMGSEKSRAPETVTGSVVTGVMVWNSLHVFSVFLGVLSGD